MSNRALIAALALVLAACSDDAEDADDDRPVATTATIDSLRNAWLAAAAKDDAATVAAMYTDDAVFVATGVAPSRGRAAIQQAWAESFPITTVDNLESKEIVISGDVGYDYGEYTQTVTPPNAAPQTIKGHYLVTFRRQPDGSWKLSKHISTTPAAPMPAP